jgi:hypothetical protein
MNHIPNPLAATMAIFLALTCSSTSAAAHPCKGYIVTLGGDTQQVFIRLPSAIRKTQDEVKVVDAENHEIQIYHPADLRAYGYWIKSGWKKIGEPRPLIEHQFVQFFDAANRPVFAEWISTGSRVDAYNYFEWKGLFQIGVQILQKRSGERLAVHWSDKLPRIKEELKAFFQDDAKTLAWITDRSFRDPSIQVVELYDLLRIYNGLEPDR